MNEYTEKEPVCAENADNREKVLSFLKGNKIDFKIQQHKPVFTMEELEDAGIENPDAIVKNLFLRNANGKQHFLVAVCGEKTVNLKAMRGQLGCSALSFASEERLQKYLGLKKGSVSLFGVINDEDKAVRVLLDRDILKMPVIGVHPNENTATLFITPNNIIKALDITGHPAEFIDI